MPYFVKILEDFLVAFLTSVADNDIIFKSLGSTGIYYDYIVTSEDAVANKPNKAFFLYAATVLGVDFQDMILVGDSLIDDIVAKDLGIDTIWINRLHKDLSGPVKPEITIYTLSELVEML